MYRGRVKCGSGVKTLKTCGGGSTARRGHADVVESTTMQARREALHRAAKAGDIDEINLLLGTRRRRELY